MSHASASEPRERPSQAPVLPPSLAARLAGRHWTLGDYSLDDVLLDACGVQAPDMHRLQFQLCLDECC